MNPEAICCSVAHSAFGLSLGAVWQHIEVECRSIPDNMALRKRLFFHLLQQLLQEGRARLASNGHYLTGTVAEQLQCFTDAWPPSDSDDEWDNLDDAGFWFMAKAPAGLVWITSEGQEVWT